MTYISNEVKYEFFFKFGFNFNKVKDINDSLEYTYDDGIFHFIDKDDNIYSFDEGEDEGNYWFDINVYQEDVLARYHSFLQDYPLKKITFP